MENQIFGILTIIACSIGYYYSWKYHKQDSYTGAILLLMLCGLALRAYVSTDFFLHSWDERFHALFLVFGGKKQVEQAALVGESGGQ